MNKLELKTIGDKEIVVTRRFSASPEAVYKAHTEPALIQQWLLGPEGWTMPVCISEAYPGGKIRYEWSDGKGNGFYIAGEFIELSPFTRIRHIERMYLPDPTPENDAVTTFEAVEGGTLLTLRMTLPNKEARDAMLASGMEGGLEESYARFEGLSTSGQLIREPSSKA